MPVVGLRPLVVSKREKLSVSGAIALLLPQADFERALTVLRGAPLIKVLPMRRARLVILVSGSEVFGGLYGTPIVHRAMTLLARIGNTRGLGGPHTNVVELTSPRRKPMSLHLAVTTRWRLVGIILMLFHILPGNGEHAVRNLMQLAVLIEELSAE